MDVCILSSFNFTFKPDSFLRSKIMLTITTNTNLNIKWKSQLKSATKKNLLRKNLKKKKFDYNAPLLKTTKKKHKERMNKRTNERVCVSQCERKAAVAAVYVCICFIDIVSFVVVVCRSSSVVVYRVRINTCSVEHCSHRILWLRVLNCVPNVSVYICCVLCRLCM